MMAFLSEWRERRYQRMVQRHVDQAGCHVTKVVDLKKKQPTFAYSTGFPMTVGQGELIIFGMPADTAHHIINHVLEICRTSAVKLEDGVRLPVVEGAEMVVRQVLPEHITPQYFRDAIAFHRAAGGDLTTVFQLVWPAPETLAFPWDDGFPQELRAFQPALYETTAS